MKLLLITAIGILCLATACKKSSNTTPGITIVGTWYETKIVLNQTTNGANPSTETTKISDKSSYVVFNSNGTGSTTDAGQTSNFTYSLSGSSLTLTPDADNGTYTAQSLTSTGFILHEVFSYQQSGETISGTIDDYFSK